MANKGIQYNQFHSFFNQTILRRGLTSVDVAEQLSEGDSTSARQYPWQLSFKPTLTILSRIKYLNRLGSLLMEPLSKLMFLSGLNPWATRLQLNDQIVLWQFCERCVKCKEDSTGKPTIAMFNTFIRELFGGLTVEDNDYFIEMVKSGQATVDEENLGDSS